MLRIWLGVSSSSKMASVISPAATKGSYLLNLPLVDKGSWIGMLNALQE
jgi:hypothetical protein